jgi:hypothetical protein
VAQRPRPSSVETCRRERDPGGQHRVTSGAAFFPREVWDCFGLQRSPYASVLPALRNDSVSARRGSCPRERPEARTDGASGTPRLLRASPVLPNAMVFPAFRNDSVLAAGSRRHERLRNKRLHVELVGVRTAVNCLTASCAVPDGVRASGCARPVSRGPGALLPPGQPASGVAGGNGTARWATESPPVQLLHRENFGVASDSRMLSKAMVFPALRNDSNSAGLAGDNHPLRR